MQIVIDIPDAIAQRLQNHWSNLTQKILELLFQAAQQAELVSEAEAKALLQPSDLEPNPEILAYMEQQAILYDEQREHLLQTHLGQYVRFENGQILDADQDLETLILRTYAATGPRDVFIRQVRAEEPTPFVRTPLF
jgi:uncharacterized protein (DUF3084 family)